MSDLLDLAGIDPTPSHHYTERDMLDALHARYSQTSQGTSRRYVTAEHVRVACGFGGVSFEQGIYQAEWRTMRTADFLAQDCREAQGIHLHGHEVKVSRSDWLTELADPSKADAIKRYCDFWWLVIPDRGIVRDDLPDDWGLIALDRTGKLRVVRRAPKLDPEPHPPTFRASLMRAVAKTAQRLAVAADPDTIRAIRARKDAS